MSYLSAFPVSNLSFDSRECLARALKDNKGSYTINKDGFVSIDFTSEEVIKAITRQIEDLSCISEDREKTK